jgi:hypothetical protein
MPADGIKRRSHASGISASPVSKSSSSQYTPVVCGCGRGEDELANVRFGSKADICSALAYVRFVPIAEV